jgi:hypothetical protein
MEPVGKNQFNWSEENDRLLTFMDDILFMCAHPIKVASAIWGYNIGLSSSEAARADAALELVVCLQLAFWKLLYISML